MDKTTKVLEGNPNILINSRDYCALLAYRKNRFVDIPECWYCKYASFKADYCNGVCRFNNNEEMQK